ncbi:MAG: response regulator transcription factor [Actinobacteria bacterium]|jgi:DNA-binding response OmpR family regulator|nr:response regulator transcription factor [Actinomycetota bacterium]
MTAYVKCARLLEKMSSDGGSVVIVEDDSNIADLASAYLSKAGYSVRQAGDGARALDLCRTQNPCLVILDIGLPGDLDGFEVCRTLRATSDVPIIILTARSDEIDRIVGLEIGADDYIVKPFSPRELVARVKAILRRSTRMADSSSRIIHINDITIDMDARSVAVSGSEVHLTSREFDLLVFIAMRRGVALSRRQLLNGAWSNSWIGDERTVDVHVRQLRKKLGDGLNIHTVWGVGYRLD